MKIVKISKTYERKISRDYQTYLYATTLDALVEIDETDTEALKKASDELFLKAFWLTQDDINQTFPTADVSDTTNSTSTK